MKVYNYGVFLFCVLCVYVQYLAKTLLTTEFAKLSSFCKRHTPHIFNLYNFEYEQIVCHIIIQQ